jgi:DNA-damage-inducible protein J
MRTSSVVRARIDEDIKNEASAVLKAMGLTVSDAFRLLMVKIAREKALPFEPLVPNEETIEAMKAARRGELVTVGSPRELLTSLNEDC